MPKNRYAVIMIAKGMREGVNAFINGLDYHDNIVDFYLVGGPDDQEYVEEAKKIQDLKVNLIFVDINKLIEKYPAPGKRGGWHVRFFRYKVAETIGRNYEAVLIVDADMLCVNNFMKYFKVAHDTGFLVLPNNSWGSSIEKVQDIGIEFLKGASSPPFHNMPLFIDCNKYEGFLHKVFEWGKVEDWGDMVQVSRTIFREKLLDSVFPLPNNLWVVSSWYYDLIKPAMAHGKKYFVQAEERIFTIHRRWWMPTVCTKFVGDIKEADNLVRGKNNARLFFDEYKRMNTSHKIKIPFDLKYDG